MPRTATTVGEEDRSRPNPDWVPVKRGEIVGCSCEYTKRGLVIYEHVAQGGKRLPRRRPLTKREVRRLLDS